MKQLLVILMLLCSACVFAQDVIVKKDGSTILCRVVELTSSEIVYKKWSDLKGSNYVMNRTDASAINYQNGKKIDLSKATNLYMPNNQNDGVQHYNDRALLDMYEKEHPTKKRKFRWNIRVGYSFDDFTGCEYGSSSANSGIDAEIGVLYPFPKSDLVIGFDVFYATIGAKVSDESFSSSSFGCSPYLGYQLTIANKLSITPYIGPYICYKYAKGVIVGNNYSDNRRIRYDIGGDPSWGCNIGVNCFISNNFYLNFHCKKALNTTCSEHSYASYSNNDDTMLHAIKYVFGVGCIF